MKTRTAKKNAVNLAEKSATKEAVSDVTPLLETEDKPLIENNDNSLKETESDALEELRKILVSPETEQIEVLHTKVTRLETDFAEALKPEEISPILPQAIRESNNENNLLREATLPLVEANIRVSAKRNPQVLAEAIFPIIGPAIRKAIAEALSQMIQSLNKTLDNSFSPRGLKWRLESWQTGKPFGEIVLLNTLIYRVEQVFLIHRETGLLLRHATANPADIHTTVEMTMRDNAAMISAMLTAIQDFAKDSFKTSPTDQLESLEYGDLNIWIEHAPKAILAVVIRGTAPIELRKIIAESLEKISFEQRRELETFNGDTAPFSLSQPHLDNCLRFQLGETSPKSRNYTRLLGLGLLLIFLVAGLFWVRDYWRWTNLLQNLRAEKGIVVTEAKRGWFSHSITGLRDALGKSPQDIVKESGYADSGINLNFGNYQALDDEFVLRRAQIALNPPESITLKFADGTLSASGTASQSWFKEAEKTARFLAGVNKFEKSEVSTDFRFLKSELEKTAIYFVCNTTELAPNQTEKIAELRENIRKLREIAEKSELKITLEVIGHSNPLGSPESRQAIARQRAEKIRDIFFSNLPESDSLKVVPVVGEEQPNGECKTVLAIKGKPANF